jgi:hypothetical protein
VEDASTRSLITVELISAGSKVLELSDYYNVGNSQIFARVGISPSSAQVLDVSMRGARVASVQSDGSGVFQITQNGRHAFTVDGDMTKGDAAPWVTVRSSSALVATMVNTVGTILGARGEVLELNVTPPNDPKLLLACVLGIITFFDWPRPAGGR